MKFKVVSASRRERSRNAIKLGGWASVSRFFQFSLPQPTLLVGEHLLEPLLFVASMPLRPLLGSPSEEPQDDSGGDPIVVLMKIGAERGPVVVDIEQADLDVSGWMDVYSAARFNRKTVLR